MKRLAMPDKFIEHGMQPELYRECGIDDVAVVPLRFASASLAMTARDDWR